MVVRASLAPPDLASGGGAPKHALDPRRWVREKRKAGASAREVAQLMFREPLRAGGRPPGGAPDGTALRQGWGRTAPAPRRPHSQQLHARLLHRPIRPPPPAR